MFAALSATQRHESERTRLASYYITAPVLSFRQIDAETVYAGIHREQQSAEDQNTLGLVQKMMNFEQGSFQIASAGTRLPLRHNCKHGQDDYASQCWRVSHRIDINALAGKVRVMGRARRAQETGGNFK